METDSLQSISLIILSTTVAALTVLHFRLQARVWRLRGQVEMGKAPQPAGLGLAHVV